MENTKYTEEFKQSIVSLYESGKSSTQICKEYGMSSSTLHKWIKKYTKVQVSETETMTMAEIKKMQKKLALLEEENIILKKHATAIKYIGLLESPRPLKIELMILYAVIKGIPAKQIIR